MPSRLNYCMNGELRTWPKLYATVVYGQLAEYEHNWQRPVKDVFDIKTVDHINKEPSLPDFVCRKKQYNIY